jgi:hypothetical protein
LSHCSRGNFLSTFKAPTPKNQNFKDLESHRVFSIENWPENWSKTTRNTTKNWQVTLYKKDRTEVRNCLNDFIWSLEMIAFVYFFGFFALHGYSTFYKLKVTSINRAGGIGGAVFGINPQFFRPFSGTGKRSE